MQANQKENFFVSDSKENFKTWSTRKYISEGIKESVANSNLLIVPTEKFRDVNKPMFPVGTESLWHFFKENENDVLNVEICIADEEYEELALHGALIIIGTFVVTSVVAPIAVNLISNYLEKKWANKIDEPDTNIKVSFIVVEEDGSSKQLTYEGPANKFEETYNKTLNEGDDEDKKLTE